MAEASSKRLVNLASQWEKHRVPLIEQYRKLKDSAAGAMVPLYSPDVHLLEYLKKCKVLGCKNIKMCILVQLLVL